MFTWCWKAMEAGKPDDEKQRSREDGHGYIENEMALAFLLRRSCQKWLEEPNDQMLSLPSLVNRSRLQAASVVVELSGILSINTPLESLRMSLRILKVLCCLKTGSSTMKP